MRGRLAFPDDSSMGGTLQGQPRERRKRGRGLHRRQNRDGNGPTTKND